MIEYNKNGTIIKVFASEFDPKVPHSIADSVLEVFDEILLMPDTHVGKSVPIGFVGKFTDKIIPSVVGVDIGCGMMSATINKRSFDFQELENFINAKIPSGFNVHSRERKVDMLDDLSFELRNPSHIKQSLGTLGGGNHFIEIVDGGDDMSIVVHTGSRNLGKQVCEWHEAKLGYDKEGYEAAKSAIISECKVNGKQVDIPQKLADIDKNDFTKKYLTDEELDYYINDMLIAQRFAFYNRKAIMVKLLEFFNELSNTELIDVPHNYIDFSTKTIHKGSISAKQDELLIIPLNMRDGVVFALGKGNNDWMQSAPHGAGRQMSRSQAKRYITLEEFQKEMEGIGGFSVTASTIDEAPFAYKDATQVINDSRETIEIIEIKKPIFNFKAK